MKQEKYRHNRPGALRTISSTLVLIILLPFTITAVIILFITGRYSTRTVPEGFTRPSNVPGGDGFRTMAEILPALQRIGFRRRLPQAAAALLYGLIDGISLLLGFGSKTAGIVYPYPERFRRIVVEEDDGNKICGVIAMQPGDDRRPALIITHSLFGSKNSHAVLALALKAWHRWGFHVLALDMRNSGDAARLSGMPTSWGLHESGDILVMASYLRDNPKVSTVGVVGTGLGAASAILAAARSGAEGPINGGVVAMNSYANTSSMLKTIGQVPQRLTTKSAIPLFFSLMLAMKSVTRAPQPYTDPFRYTNEIISQYYETPAGELLFDSSPISHIHEIEIPCLLIHSKDDFVIPAESTEDITLASMENPFVEAIVVPHGGHGLYHLVCPGWYYTTLRSFFTYWAGPETTGVPTAGMPENSIDRFRGPKKQDL